mgnify:CR=1 FL=1
MRISDMHQMQRPSNDSNSATYEMLRGSAGRPLPGSGYTPPGYAVPPVNPKLTPVNQR